MARVVHAPHRPCEQTVWRLWYPGWNLPVRACRCVAAACPHRRCSTAASGWPWLPGSSNPAAPHAFVDAVPTLQYPPYGTNPAVPTCDTSPAVPTLRYCSLSCCSTAPVTPPWRPSTRATRQLAA